MVLIATLVVSTFSLLLMTLLLLLVFFKKFHLPQKGTYNLNREEISQAVTESPEVRHVSPERETTPHETDDPLLSAGECTLGNHEVTLDLSSVNGSFYIQCVQLF